MIKAEVVVRNEVGLHARPAAVLVQTALKYKADIKLLKDSRAYNCKSVLGLLSMGSKKGDVLMVLAEGEDENEALNEIVALIGSFED